MNITSNNDGTHLLAGLIGCGISQSRTPRMHMAEARAQGMTGLYQILDMECDLRSDMHLSTMVAAAQACGFHGLNITYPFKIDVIPLLDDLSDNARAVGAVNTVVFRGGQRIGHNTDLWGFAQSFQRNLGGAKRENVLLIGAGGAGVAVAHALVDSGVAHLMIHDSDMARAMLLAEQLQAKRPDLRITAVRDLAEFATRGSLCGLVNATPVGMAKLPGMAAPVEILHPEMWVADIVYFPLETELLRTARALGCRVLAGSGMAVFQAVRAFELFTGRAADPARMQATFEAFDTIDSAARAVKSA